MPAAPTATSIKTAIRFEAQGLDQATPVTLYLYIFRNRDAFERNRDRIGPCAAAFVTDPDTFEEVEQSPFAVASQGPWAPGFEARLRDDAPGGGRHRRLTGTNQAAAGSLRPDVRGRRAPPSSRPRTGPAPPGTHQAGPHRRRPGPAGYCHEPATTTPDRTGTVTALLGGG